MRQIRHSSILAACVICMLLADCSSPTAPNWPEVSGDWVLVAATGCGYSGAVTLTQRGASLGGSFSGAYVCAPTAVTSGTVSGAMQSRGGSEVGWKVSVAFGTTLALSGYVYPMGAKGGGPYLGNAPPQSSITPPIGWSMDRP